NSNLDCSLENKLCWSGEYDVAKTCLGFFKADLQFVSAAREDSDRPFATFAGGEDERAGNYSSPARKRFIFHTAFIGADGDSVGSACFDEVHVCAIWRKHFVMTNRCAVTSHIGIIDFPNGDHDMRDPTVDEVNRLVFSRHR